jgi:hypothetical protein
MTPEVATQLLGIMGREAGGQGAELRGVITADQLVQARSQLEAAVAAQAPDRGWSAEDEAQAPAARSVSLRRRAWPMLELLRAAERRHHDVTWGI